MLSALQLVLLLSVFFTGHRHGALQAQRAQIVAGRAGQGGDPAHCAGGGPHIKADDWQSLGYGYGCAQAQDNLCTLADSFLTYRGERSRYFGADAVAVARSSIGAPKNIDADFFNRHVVTPVRIEALRQAQQDNPHWFWRGADRFYQAQLTIPGVFDVAGVSILGTPTIMIGCNNDVAWIHTVSSARRFGIYQLTLVADDPLTYLRDGQRVKMTAQQITIAARQADGSIADISRMLYDSQYGPLLDLGALNPALGWSRHTAFAIRDINSANGRDYRTWLRWARAGSLEEFIRIAGEEAVMPWVNTLAVGRGAPQAWFGDLGPVSNVSAGQSERCTTAIGKMVAQRLPGVPFFDGADSACDWQGSRDSVQDGAMSGQQMPSLLRSDYVANMNDSYWSTNPHALLSGFPRVLGSEGGRGAP